MTVKVTNGQICIGTISKIYCHQEYYLCEKFHACIILHLYQKVHTKPPYATLLSIHVLYNQFKHLRWLMFIFGLMLTVLDLVQI